MSASSATATTPPSTSAPAAPQAAPRLTAGAFTMNILNALALGTVIVLIPGALVGEVSKAILKAAPEMTWLLPAIQATTMSNSMLGLVVGVLAGQMFKLSPIAQGSIGLACMWAGGAVLVGEQNALSLKGTGDVITIGVTAAIAVGIVLLLQKLIKNLATYQILILPAAVLVVGGLIGRALLPHIMLITKIIGQGVAGLMTLAPPVMAVLLAVVFSILIVSPITTVGIALAISLAGVASGAANAGVCAAAFGLAIAGWSVNSRGVSLAHFIGSPKMSMPNVMKNPKIILPTICSAAICGLIAWALGIQGTPMSAGFGFSGLVGPLAHLGIAGWGVIEIVKVLIALVIAPVALGIGFNILFTKVLKVISVDDYRLDIA